MTLAPHEIVLEDQRSVSGFLQERLEAAQAEASSTVVHDLLLAVQVGHRRVQRALSLVFDGSSDVRLKRKILERYAALDRMLDRMQAHHDSAATAEMMRLAPDMVGLVEEGFSFARDHLHEIRGQLPRARASRRTRPSPPQEFEITAARVWFDDGFDEDATTLQYRYERRLADQARRGG